MNEKQIERLQYLLKEIIAVINYQPDISLQHKKHLLNSYRAFENSFTSPTPAENQDPEQ